MADLGADVVKIEEAGVGDEARRVGPFPGDVPHPERSGLFLYLNSNKRGITLNLETETGQAILHELIGSADVLVNNFPLSVSKELGLQYEILQEVNERLIMLSLTPFGQTGPYSSFKGYEINAASLGGVVLQIGKQGEEPIYPAQFLGQYQSGVAGATGVMVALTARDRTGQGQHIDLAEADVWATFHTGMGVVAWLFGERRTLREGRRSRGGPYPHTILPCKDGDIRLIAMTKREWVRFLGAMGNPEWGNDPRFQDRIKMNELYADELDALITPWLMERTKQELFELFYEHSVPFTPIKNIEDMVNDPHLAASNFFVDIDHPETGVTKYPGPPYRLSATPLQIGRPAPLLGQHNEEIYCERLDYTNDDLARLRQASVI